MLIIKQLKSLKKIRPKKFGISNASALVRLFTKTLSDSRAWVLIEANRPR